MPDEPTETTPAAKPARRPEPPSPAEAATPAASPGVTTAAEGSPASAMPARRFRHRELAQADGSRLVLTTDGRIDHFDTSGASVGSWDLDDPDWPRLALRFGIRQQPETVAPHGPDTGGRNRPW